MEDQVPFMQYDKRLNTVWVEHVGMRVRDFDTGEHLVDIAQLLTEDGEPYFEVRILSTGVFTRIPIDPLSPAKSSEALSGFIDSQLGGRNG